MADIRCPMCGKSNSASADVCQHCQARLKPLIAASADAGAPAKPGDSGVPDWLSGLVPADEGFDSGSGFEPEKTENDVTDWLARLGGSESPKTSPGSNQEALPEWLTATTPKRAGDPNVPDWMDDLGVKAEQSATPSSTSSDEEEDWLKRIRARQAEEAESASPFAGPPVGTQPLEPAPDTELPDWLSSLGAEQKPPEKPADLPDWLIQSGSAATESAAPADSAPDWLQSSDQPVEGRATFDRSMPAKPAADLPDWFTQAEPSATDAAVPADSIPEWMHAPGLSAPAEPVTDLPDWLAGDRPEGESSASFLTESADGGLPDWVTNAPAQAFNDMNAAEYRAPVQPTAGSSTPDWLSKLGAPAGGESASSGVPAFVMDQGDEESSGPTSGLEDFAAGGADALPDWLTKVSSEQPPVEHVSPIEIETAPDLAPAQLPTWLEAMRPVEAAAPMTPFAEDNDRQQMESAGPLAGLRGALAAEPDVIGIRKPPAYSTKLHVPDAQQATITLLQEMMSAEGQVKPVVLPTRPATQYIMRIATALVLLFAVVWTLWAGPIMTLPEVNGLPGIIDLYNSVNVLPANTPVLLAFDYEPAFSGEMDAAASAVVQHLAMTKGAYLILLSTSPTGPALAESFVSRIGSQFGMTLTQVANLGYIPGGQNGLLAFARKPSEIAPYALDAFIDPDYVDIWSNNPLQADKGLGNFGLVLVMTDNPDTARAWIEQVEPELPEGVPLLMVVSAQAEPLVRPYYDSGQVNGLLSGLTGGAAFEKLVGYSGPAKGHWDGLSAGLFAASVLILVGAVANFTLASLNRSQQKKGKKAI